MEALMQFLSMHGFALTGIALAGIIILGILKYANLFERFEEPKKKAIYLGISVGLSFISSFIYTICIGQSIATLGVLFGSIYALNQTMYSVYSNTSLKALVNKGLEMLKVKVKEYFKDNKEVTEIIENIETFIEKKEGEE